MNEMINSNKQHLLPPNWKNFVCTKENLALVWTKLNEFPILFDDSVRGDFNFFLAEMLAKSSIILMTGDYGICEITSIVPYRDCEIHLAFWDRRFKGRLEECKQVLRWMFSTLSLHRATIKVPSIAYSTISFIKALGFTREGIIRDCWSLNGRYINVWEFGILANEVFSDRVEVAIEEAPSGAMEAPNGRD